MIATISAIENVSRSHCLVLGALYANASAPRMIAAEMYLVSTSAVVSGTCLKEPNHSAPVCNLTTNACSVCALNAATGCLLKGPIQQSYQRRTVPGPNSTNESRMISATVVVAAMAAFHFLLANIQMMSTASGYFS